MDFVDYIGFLACGLVLLTFCMRSMRLLRCVALASNLAFIAYAVVGDLVPVLLLHAVLVPINLWYVVQDDTRLSPSKKRSFVE